MARQTKKSMTATMAVNNLFPEPKAGEVWENIALAESVTNSITKQTPNRFEIVDVTDFMPDGTGEVGRRYVGYRTSGVPEAATWRDVSSFTNEFRRVAA